MTDLGTLGGSFSSGDAINEMGWVVGLAEDGDGDYHSVIWLVE